jgi:hypothetical protein
MEYRLKMMLPVVGMFLLFGAVTLVIVGNQNNEMKQPLPASLDNLATTRLVEIRDAGGQVVLSGSFTITTKDNGDIDGEATLTATAVGSNAEGKAEIEVSTEKGTEEKELEVEVYKLTPRASFNLFVDGQQITAFSTNQRGDAELEITNQPQK